VALVIKLRTGSGAPASGDISVGEIVVDTSVNPPVAYTKHSDGTVKQLVGPSGPPGPTGPTGPTNPVCYPPPILDLAHA